MSKVNDMITPKALYNYSRNVSCYAFQGKNNKIIEKMALAFKYQNPKYCETGKKRK